MRVDKIDVALPAISAALFLFMTIAFVVTDDVWLAWLQGGFAASFSIEAAFKWRRWRQECKQ